MSVQRKKVSDPALIETLNQRSMGKKVQNPYLLDELNNQSKQEKPQEQHASLESLDIPYNATDALRDLGYGAAKGAHGSGS